jgi:RNA polymerase sigma-B factor
MIHDEVRMSDREATELIEKYRRTGDVQYRNQVVEGHAWLAAVCARRMVRRSEPLDDLVQVASIGILQAAERFDPSFGVLFRTFASATAEGELRRHYRGTWRIRVARGLQELHLQVSAAIDHLTSTRQASPTLHEVAEFLGKPYDDVVDAYVAGASHQPAPLEPRTDESDEIHESSALGRIDADFDRVVDRYFLDDLMARLPERQRIIVEYRFTHQMSQSEIAQRLDLSQAHVSRLLRDAIQRMRTMVSADRSHQMSDVGGEASPAGRCAGSSESSNGSRSRTAAVEPS